MRMNTPSPTQPASIGDGLGMAFVRLSHSYVLTLHVFLRRGFGERRCEPFDAVTGLLFVFLYTVLYSLIVVPLTVMIGVAAAPSFAALPAAAGPDFTPLWMFALAYLPALFLHGWPHWRRFVTDRFIRHYSLDEGRPVLAVLFPGLKAFQVKLFVEPLALLALGVPVAFVNGPLGGYLILGSVALFNLEWFNHGRDRGHIVDIIDQHQLAQRTTAMLRDNVDEAPGEEGKDEWHRVVGEAFEGGKADAEVSLADMVGRLEPAQQELLR